MKINEHQVILSSRHSMTEQAHDFFREDHVQIPRAEALAPFDSPSLTPLHWMDRVSLSSREVRARAQGVQFTSDSRILDSEGGVKTLAHTHILEQLVGGAIDREVVIGNLEGPGADLSENMTPAPVGLGAWETRFTHTQIQYEGESLAFFSRGKLFTEDGRAIEFDLSLEMERSFLSRTQQELLIQGVREKVTLVDPLMVNLAGGIPGLSNTRFEFDLDKDGENEILHTAAAGSGFLALDLNGDGVINDGGELFGPATGNGFAELGQWDVDGNQWIDENDPVFDQLKVWRRTQGGEDELISLKAAGIGAIHLDNALTPFKHDDEEGQTMGQVRRSGVFLFEDGRAGVTQQVDFAILSNGGDEGAEIDPVVPSKLEGLVAMEDHQAQIRDAVAALKEQIQILRNALNEQLMERARKVFSRPLEGIGLLKRMDPLDLVAAHGRPLRFFIKG